MILASRNEKTMDFEMTQIQNKICIDLLNTKKLTYSCLCAFMDERRFSSIDFST